MSGKKAVEQAYTASSAAAEGAVVQVNTTNLQSDSEVGPISQTDDNRGASLNVGPITAGACCDPGVLLVLGVGCIIVVGCVAAEWAIVMKVAGSSGTAAAIGTGAGFIIADVGLPTLCCYSDCRNAIREEREKERRAAGTASASSSSEVRSNGPGFFERLFCCGHQSAPSEKTPLVRQPVQPVAVAPGVQLLPE